ncbi:zf-HC2 domain-containing protein [Castellaniella ginsengisoli]|uniref:Zf-HC2 domain-containing protein n=1 Tax=Castellaniella ginsengisoli TaxID=546114 RepID=A0AB39ESM6_9BURK
MPCPRTRLLCACLDPEWAGRRRALVEAHVARCPICEAELEALRSMTAGLRALPDPAGAPDVARSWRPAPAGRRPARRRSFTDILLAGLGWLPAGAAVTASLAVGIGMADQTWPAAAPASPPASMARLDVFGPVPPGGLCAAGGLCGSAKERT